MSSIDFYRNILTEEWSWWYSSCIEWLLKWCWLIPRS